MNIQIILSILIVALLIFIAFLEFFEKRKFRIYFNIKNNKIKEKENSDENYENLPSNYTEKEFEVLENHRYIILSILMGENVVNNFSNDFLEYLKNDEDFISLIKSIILEKRKRENNYKELFEIVFSNMGNNPYRENEEKFLKMILEHYFNSFKDMKKFKEIYKIYKEKNNYIEQ